jgi:asparagine synthase (glutamine-hydrolysing)
VPLGFFLRGGIDWTAAVAAAASFRPAASLDTFTIGFTDRSFDESAYAREAATHYGTRHHEGILDLEAGKQLLAPVLGRLDEPLGDASILPTYMVSRFAREHVTVILTGDGGDELFAGYDPFKALLPARITALLVPGSAHRGLRRLADLLPISRRNMSVDFKLRRFLGGLSYPMPFWNPVWLAPVEPRDMADLLMEPAPIEEVYREALECWESTPGTPIDRTLAFYTRFYLQDDVLAKVDRASMMSGLESRAAFLDNDLVAFCTRLPSRLKFAHGRGKHLLRRALQGVVPDTVLDRPKKGFGVPVSRWLRGIDAPLLGDIPGFRTATLNRWWREHAEGQKDHRLALWSGLSLHHHLGAIEQARQQRRPHATAGIENPGFARAGTR